MPGKEEADAPSWLLRVEDDEMRTLIRASANYARLGHDPGLATNQRKAQSRTQREKDAIAAKAKRERKWENDYMGSVPTHYKNFATGRTLTTELPAVRPQTRGVRPPSPISAELSNALKQAELAGTASDRASIKKTEEALMKAAGVGYENPMENLHPSRIPLVKTQQTTFRSIDAQHVVVPQALMGPQHVAHAKSMSAAGVSKAALAALEDTAGDDAKVPKPSDVLKRYKLFNTRAEDEAQGQHMHEVMTPHARHADKAAMPVGPGTIVSENRGSFISSGTALNMFQGAGAVPGNTPGLPAGAASHAILQNRMGKAGATPAPLPRGGSGLVVGDLLVMHDQLVPATLVASKWGRVSGTTYTDIPGQPNKIAVEIQPLYYESFLLDLHAVLDRSGGFTFEPLVSPGAFVVDFGRVNAHIHNAPRPEPLDNNAGRAMDAHMQPRRIEDPFENGGGVGQRGGVDVAAMLEGGGSTASGTAAGGSTASAPPGGGGDGGGSPSRNPDEQPGYTPGGVTDTKFSVGDVAFARKSGKRMDNLDQDIIRASKQRNKGKPKKVAAEPTNEEIYRAELSMAVENTKEKAQRLLVKLASDGNDAAIDRLCKDGIEVEMDAESWRKPPPQYDENGNVVKPKPMMVLPEVDLADEKGNTPLMIAARNGWVDAVLVLLKLGADHKRRNHAGQSPLDFARVESNTASMALSVNMPGAAQRKRRAAKLASILDDRTVLVCAQKGDHRRLEYLVDDCDHPVNAVNAYGMTPLHFAVLRKDSKMARFLTERGADINARNNLGQSPLSLALEMDKGTGQNDMLKSLDAQDAHALADIKAMRELHEEAMRRQKEEEAIVQKLKTYTKGTSAARAVYAALGSVGRAGKTADFSAGASGMSTTNLPIKEKTSHTPALAKTIGLVTIDGHVQSGGRHHGPPPPQTMGKPLGPLKYTPITKSERTGLLAAANAHDGMRAGSADAVLTSSSKGLAESWNRHTLNYIAVAEKQQKAAESRAYRATTEASDLAVAEIRRGRLNPAHAPDFVAEKAGPLARTSPEKFTGGVSAAVAASNPTAMIKAEHGLRNVAVPGPDSARFEAWARMRFGQA